jgi:hypothetical protein
MKKIILFAIAVASAFLTSGCSASYQGIYLNQPSNHVYTPSRFLLVTPASGVYNNTVYPSSGPDVIAALTKELQRYTQSVAIIPVPVTIEQIFPQDLERTDYVIIPQILHWEDRATGWSFIPDRIEVRFDIFDNQRRFIDSYLIQGRSAYIVWVSKQPNSLLAKPIRKMLTELFAKAQ